jgi:hypothetical protein
MYRRLGSHKKYLCSSVIGFKKVLWFMEVNFRRYEGGLSEELSP